MTIPDRISYAKALYQRIPAAVIVPLRTIQITLEDDSIWQPAARECHANATHIERFYPQEIEAVRGWLVFDYTGLWGEVHFMPHSVVRERQTGVMFDPTPQTRMNPDYQFIEADPADGSFDDLVSSMKFGEMLVYRI